MKGLYVTSSSAALTGTTYKKVCTLSLKYQGQIIGSTEIKIFHTIAQVVSPILTTLYHWSQTPAWPVDVVGEGWVASPAR